MEESSGLTAGLADLKINMSGAGDRAENGVQPIPEHSVSLGKFLAGRLTEIGVTHAFAVPGDFNLTL